MDPFQRPTFTLASCTSMRSIDPPVLSLSTSPLQQTMSPVTTAAMVYVPQPIEETATGQDHMQMYFDTLDNTGTKQMHLDTNLSDGNIEQLLSDICKNDLVGGNSSSVSAAHPESSADVKFDNMDISEGQRDILGDKLSNLMNMTSSPFVLQTDLPSIETLMSPIFEQVEGKINEATECEGDSNAHMLKEYIQTTVTTAISSNDPILPFEAISKSPTSTQVSPSAQVKPESSVLSLYRRGRPGRKPLPGGPKRRRSYTEKGSDEYFIKRARNNEAIRKCREKAKQKQKEMEEKMTILETENAQLRQKLEIVTKELNELKGKHKSNPFDNS